MFSTCLSSPGIHQLLCFAPSWLPALPTSTVPLSCSLSQILEQRKRKEIKIRKLTDQLSSSADPPVSGSSSANVINLLTFLFMACGSSVFRLLVLVLIMLIKNYRTLQPIQMCQNPSNTEILHHFFINKKALSEINHFTQGYETPRTIAQNTYKLGGMF